MSSLQAPHRHIETHNARERFLVDLFDTLWVRYRSRMAHVRKYEEIIQKHNARFVNDHIAFRTLGTQKPSDGRFAIARIAQALGYRPAAAYEFPDKSLSSIHYEPPNPQLPKLFVTELKTWELTAAARRIIQKSTRSHRPAVPDELLSSLFHLEEASAGIKKRPLAILSRFFADLPWPVPEKKDVLKLNEETQFGAWTLVNGYDVNHFTSLVNSHGVPELNDIEKTVEAMKQAGVPMKKEIEGERGSKLRQSSTEAVTIDVPVRENGRKTKMPWTYAYFEFAERPPFPNPATGRMERFEGFLGGQATNLFEMTRTR